MQACAVCCALNMPAVLVAALVRGTCGGRHSFDRLSSGGGLCGLLPFRPPLAIDGCVARGAAEAVTAV
jgi:hypothetical protein